MTDQEYIEGKAALEGELATAKQAHAAAALKATMGKGTDAEAKKARKAVSDLEEALETLKIAYGEAQKEAAAKHRKEMQDHCDKVRTSVSKKLDKQVALAKELRTLSEKMGKAQQEIEQLSQEAGEELHSIAGPLREHFQHLHRSLKGRPQSFRTKLAGHMASTGVVLEGVNFNSARMDANNVPLDEWMKTYNDALKSRLAILDKMPEEA